MATLQSKLVLSLTDRVSGPARAINATLSRLHQSMDRTRTALLDSVGVGYVLAKSISAPIKSAMDFESAMADVKKVVDFDSAGGLERMAKSIREMSTRIPIAADGLAKIVAAGGQSGIDTKDLTRFTELAAKLGVAWEISADEAGSSIAKLMTSLGRSIDETASLGDAINYLSDKSAASAPDILDVVKRVGPMAKQFGFSAEQVAALGAAMAGSGFQSEIASTSILNVGKALTKGTSATARQKAAFKALGLSSKTVAKAMQRDAVGTLQDVLGRINRIPKEAQAALVSDLFGDEARALGPLISNGKLLADVMALIGDKSKYANSAQREFESRSKTSANNLQLFRNRLNDLSISVGNALLPAMNKLLDKLGPIVTSISELAERYPKLISAVVGTTAALVGARIAFLALKFAGLFAATGLLAFAAKALKVGAVLGRLLRMGTLFGVALTALGAAGAFIYKNWNGIATMFSQFGRSFKQAIEPIWPLLKPVTDGAQRLYDWVSKLLGPVDGLGDSWFRMGHRAGKAVGEALVSITKFVTDLPNKLKAVDWSAMGKSASDAVKSALETVRSLIASYDWSSLGNAIGQGIAAAFGALKDLHTSLISAILGGDSSGTSIAASIGASLGNAIKSFDWIGLGRSINSLIIEGVKANLSILNGIFRGAFNIDLAAAGSQAINSLWNGMKSAFDGMMAWVRTIPSQIQAALAGITIQAPKINYGGSQMGPVKTDGAVDGKRASGGPVRAGGVYLVGERGPELFSPRNAGVITPNHALTAGGRAAPVITMHNTITVSGVTDPRAAAASAADQLGLKVRNAVESANTD